MSAQPQQELMSQVAPPQAAAPQVWNQALQTPQVIMVTGGGRKSRYNVDNYKAKRVIGIGGTLITLGILAILSNMANVLVQLYRRFAYVNWIPYVGTGALGGIFYITCGAEGIRAAKTKTILKIRNELALGITGFLLGLVDLGWAIATVAIEANLEYDDDRDEDADETDRTLTMCLSAMSAILATVAASLCVVAAELSGRVICAPAKQDSTVGTEIQTGPGISHQMVVLNLPQAAASGAGIQNTAYHIGHDAAQDPPPSYDAMPEKGGF